MPLSTIVAIQFVPLLAICAVIATFTWRRTGSSLPGALICGLFVHLVRGGGHGHAGGVLAPCRQAKRWAESALTRRLSPAGLAVL